MVVRDEERFLRRAVEHVLRQNYPGALEVVIAVGPSRDRTQRIADELAAADSRVRVIDNPSGQIPAGLNAAIGNASHEIIARVDGHAILDPGYLRHAAQVLQETDADNVGGRQAAIGETAYEAALAHAYLSRLGRGGRQRDRRNRPGAVDTVYLGVFRRQTLARLGGYDESLLRCEDWELNYRIRQAGGIVWFCPDLAVTYLPRVNVVGLARQFFLYGRWRRAVVRRHPGTLSLRYMAAPAVVLMCAMSAALGLAGLLMGLEFLSAALVVPGGYVTAVAFAGLTATNRLSWRVRGWCLLIVPTMHLSWGAGFLTSPRRIARPPGHSATMGDVGSHPRRRRMDPLRVQEARGGRRKG